MFISDHPNAHFLGRIYGALSEHGLSSETSGEPAGLDLLKQSVDEDFVCHCDGDSPVSGRFVGWDAMETHAAKFAELCDDTMSHEPLAIYADDTWAFVPQMMSVSRKGETMTMSVVGGWRFSGPGRIAEHWELVSDQAAWDAFWSA